MPSESAARQLPYIGKHGVCERCGKNVIWGELLKYDPPEPMGLCGWVLPRVGHNGCVKGGVHKVNGLSLAPRREVDSVWNAK